MSTGASPGAALAEQRGLLCCPAPQSPTAAPLTKKARQRLCNALGRGEDLQSGILLREKVQVSPLSQGDGCFLSLLHSLPSIIIWPRASCPRVPVLIPTTKDLFRSLFSLLMGITWREERSRTRDTLVTQCLPDGRVDPQTDRAAPKGQQTTLSHLEVCPSTCHWCGGTACL